MTKKSQDALDIAASPKTSVFQEIPFRFYLGARTISLLGDRIADFAIPYILITTTGSAFAAGFAGAVEQLPTILLALWIGTIIDRSSPLTAMLAADFARAALFIAIALLLNGNTHALWLLALLLFCVGIANVWFRVAAGAILPTIVTRERLVSANGYTEAADAATTLMGPTLGGIIYQVGIGLSLLVNAFSFLFSGLLLLFIRQVRPESKATRPRPSLRALFTGLRVLGKVPPLRIVQLALLALNAEASAIVLLLLSLATSGLHLSPLYTGIILTGAGVGGLLTSLLLTRWLSHLRWGTLLAGIFATMALATALLALANSFIIAFFANMLLDGVAVLGFIVAGSVLQALTPDPLLGQISAASSLLITIVRTVSILLVGILITALGPRVTLGIFALLHAIIGVVLLLTAATSSPLSTLLPFSAATFGLQEEATNIKSAE